MSCVKRVSFAEAIGRLVSPERHTSALPTRRGLRICEEASAIRDILHP